MLPSGDRYGWRDNRRIRRATRALSFKPDPPRRAAIVGSSRGLVLVLPRQGRPVAATDRGGHQVGEVVGVQEKAGTPIPTSAAAWRSSWVGAVDHVAQDHLATPVSVANQLLGDDRTALRLVVPEVRPDRPVPVDPMRTGPAVARRPIVAAPHRPHRPRRRPPLRRLDGGRTSTVSRTVTANRRSSHAGAENGHLRRWRTKTGGRSSRPTERRTHRSPPGRSRRASSGQHRSRTPTFEAAGTRAPPCHGTAPPARPPQSRASAF